MSALWPIDAALLDMDGTLLDTERVYLDSLTITLSAFGYADAAEIGHAMIGLPSPVCEAMLRERYGETFPAAEIDRAFTATTRDLLKDGLPLKPGARDLLDALRDAECPMAIVTSSSRHTAEQYLTQAGIRARFAAVLTRDDVVRGKPSPDLYLRAAERLDARSRMCVAIEDSTPGVRAAHAAGAMVILVPDIVQPSVETRALCAAVLPDLHATLALLRDGAAFETARSRA